MKDIIHHGTACINQFCGTPKKDKTNIIIIFLKYGEKKNSSWLLSVMYILCSFTSV